ncbi:MAG: phosphoribulokinase [Chloroflexi bacterium]|uniref:Phosphoribulokinase n=1 Tax=Candidatus Chlorohelix allophototropha TaxID=3003348 RepID=A0A8T7LQZ6_9CHLR|nr:phosphoribulokinase [Chloroflexota bacterium]WJW66300.1 phosphoribulokinase [Chloroflexota bacterium L227-S17]
MELDVSTKRPVMLGVVGDSATGKTTLTQGIEQLLGPERVTVICVDDYHKYNRQQRKVVDLTPLHPDCNYMDIMEQHLKLLKEGKPILKPVYNHSRGDFDPPVYIQPAEYVIIDGLLAYYTKEMRDVFDIRLFLDPSEDLRRRWKITRDTTKRGYTEEAVLADLDKREPDSQEFIRPQRAFADTIVRFYPDPNNEGGSDSFLNVKLTMTGNLQHPDFSKVVTRPDGSGGVRLSMGRESGKVAEFVDIFGFITEEKALKLERYIIDELHLTGHNLEEELGQYTAGLVTRRSHPLALTQLFLVYHLLRARNPGAKPGSGPLPVGGFAR